MADDIQLAGYRTVGTFVPIPLYAGEKQPVTTQGVLKSGQKVGELNARGETYKFPVVSEVAGKLVDWDGSAPIKGILPHALDASATGRNADTPTPIFVEGVFNYEALDLDAALYADLRAAEQAPGTAITWQKLY